MDLSDFIEWRTISTADPAQHDEKVLQTIKNNLEQLWPDVVNRPPWKLLVVQNTYSTTGTVMLDIIFATHHALADGKSIVVFHNQLLLELNAAPGPPSELKNHILTFASPPILAPSQEDLVPLKISWTYLLKTFWNQLSPSWLRPTPPPLPWTGKPITPEPHKLHLRLMTIPTTAVAGLVAACRAHGTTLSGLLHILVLASISKRLPASVATSFAGETPIGLLPWARLPPGANMDLNAVLTDLTTGTKRVWDAATVSTLRERLGRPDDGAEEELVWPLAKLWRDEMRAKVATLPNDDVVGLLGYMGDMRKHWLNKVGKPRSGTWELSNVGTIKGNSAEGSGAWSIRRLLFSQPVLVAGTAFNVNVAGLEGGPVNLVLNWQETVVDDSIIEGVAEDVESWVETFVESGQFGIFSGTH